MRELPLEALYLAYQRTAMQPGEFLRALRIPRRPQRHWRFRTYKISQRFEQDISAVCAAFALELDDHDRIVSARVAFGGMAATPKRANACETALVRQAWSESTAHAAADALAKDFQPLSDMRASAEYRLGVARNLLLRFWQETAGHAKVRVSDFPPIRIGAAS
jgi:xanthine dehydrogenase small subunit